MYFGGKVLSKKKLTITAVSDTHVQHRGITFRSDIERDVLVHAGDATGRGKIEQLAEFLEWLGQQDFRYKIFVAGNHDYCCETMHDEIIRLAELYGVIYLNDSGINIEGFNFWGSPVQPRFMNWAFNRDRGQDIKRHWDLIPSNTDVLITHGPPRNILDEVPITPPHNWHPKNEGCDDLRDAIFDRVKPLLHVFGHIHSGYGKTEIDGIQFVNASQLDNSYRRTNKPITITIEK